MHLNAAASLYQQALDLLPNTAVDDLDVVHDRLGAINKTMGHVERALHHYQQSIRYAEASGNLYSAGQSRSSVALMLSEAGRFSDARDFAEAGLANFRQFGDRAADLIRGMEAILASIDGEIAKGGRP